MLQLIVGKCLKLHLFCCSPNNNYEVAVGHTDRDLGKAWEVPVRAVPLAGMQLFPNSIQYCHHGFLWLYPRTLVCVEYS